MDELTQPRIELFNGDCLELLARMEPKYYDVAVQRTSGFTNQCSEFIIREERQETTNHDDSE